MCIIDQFLTLLYKSGAESGSTHFFHLIHKGLYPGLIHFVLENTIHLKCGSTYSTICHRELTLNIIYVTAGVAQYRGVLNNVLYSLQHLGICLAACRQARDTQGIGLGLPLAKSIVEAHNGTIEADSLPGSGAVFTINLIPTKL